MHCLAIDQGNSRTKFGLFHHGTLTRTWACATDKQATAAELLAAAQVDAPLAAGIPVALCSVVSELLPSWETAARAGGWELWHILGTTPTPLQNAFETPRTLGPDRLMAAVAAVDRVDAPVIPLLLGTATVVDAVTEGGIYLGGMIAPGIGIAAEVLALRASALEPAAWQPPAQAIGRSTDTALRNGLFYASLGAIRLMIEAVRAELGTPAPLVVTGGWAPHVAPYLDGVAAIIPDLVLHGIAVTMEYQARQ